MVLINGVKYACERCIRGHRVTTCTHTDQPLMMIKPKGRPSTTCDHCKELRKNKNANPSGVCTCGRLEKKKLAQKAKEEARAKAKEEKKLHECHCGTNEPCKCHSNRRSRTSQSRKLKNNNVGSSISSRPSSQHLDSANIAGTMGHVMSPVSMDSNSSIHNGNTSNSNINGSLNKGDSSSLFTSGFLDTREHNGKISKDYHRVPSLASISSLHSGQSASFDQKLGLSRSSLLCGSNNKNNGGNFLNWIDEGKSSYPSRSDSGFNLLDNGKMNSNGMNNGSNNNNNNSSNNNNNNSNNNFANDLGIGVYFGVNDGSTNGNENRNENVNWNGNDNVNGVKIMNMNANTNMNTNTTKTENPMDEIPFNEYIEQSNNTNQNQGNNSSAPLSDWNIDKNLDVGSLTSFTQNNGLFDFFLDAPATPSFSKDPLLVQQSKFDNLKENVETQRNVNSNSNYNQNRDSTNTITNVNTNTNTNNTNNNNNNNNNNNSDINKTNVNHNQYRNSTFTNPSVHDRSDALSVDGESIRSVEATPIVQGFMDIPERAPSLQNVHLHQEQHSSNQQQKQARTSPTTNRSFRRQPSGRPPVPVTINPSMVSSIDDAISVTSLQSPVSSLIDNNGVSTSLGNGGDFGNSNIPFERSKSPQFGVLELTNAAMPSSPQSYRQRPNIHPSELDRLLGFDVGNTSGLMENSAVSESDNSVIHNGNPILRKDTAAFSSSSAKGALEEASLLSSNQETSPPSQLFAEQGFADLDDFMSTL